MSHIEGDGVVEDIYYLLWRKDSPFNEKLNIRIPDTVIFRKGRPMAWYYTTSEGAVMRKKQPSLVYPEILKKFTKGAKEGEIVAYFVNIDHEKKLERLLDKPYTKAQKQDAKNEDDTPSHDVEYYGLSDFNALFSDYKNFEGKTGILQRFIHPYGSNNELIQAIWSPRVCVFTKRVNLRRLNETRFDIYERALTFDGPDFYSKNVPLRGGYIPGKLRATCDHIVRHIAFISFEKVSINRLVGYFKVDQNENVWFLWTSSIRIGETSKTHKKISQFVDKPLCLEPCMQTSTNIRHIKSNFSTRPVTLRMTEECSICSMKVSSVSLIPVVYRLLLGNEEILKRSEKDASRIRVAGSAKDPAENNYVKPKTPKKSTIGVPHFLKKLHPHMTLKEYQALKEKEHFLMLKAYVCEACYLIVSKEYEGGFPCGLNDDHNTGGFMSARTSFRKVDSVMRNESVSRKERSSVTPNRLPSRRENLYDSGDEYDSIKEQQSQVPPESSARLYMTAGSFRKRSADSRTIKSHRLDINPDPAYSTGSKFATPSTQFVSVGSHNSQFPRFLNKTLWPQPAKGVSSKEYESAITNMEETKYDSAQQDHSNLKRDVIRALSRDLEGKEFGRSTNSMSRISLGQSLSKISSARQPARPQTTSAPSITKKGRTLKTKHESQKQTPSQYRLDEVPDLFDDSNSSGEQVIKIQKAVSYRQPIVYQTPRDPHGKESVGGGSAQRPLSTDIPDNIESFRAFGGPNKGRTKLKGYLAELNPEAKMQEHLDQDMILTMANATKKNENIYPLKAQPPTILKNKKNNYSSYSHRGESQGTVPYQSPYDLMGVSGRPNKIKAKHHSTMNEAEIMKESGVNIDSLIDKYYEGNIA